MSARADAPAEANDNASPPLVTPPVLAEITLDQLRRRSEAPHRVLNIVSTHRTPPPEAPIDEETANLTGRAYLEFLVADTRPGKRLPAELIALLSGRRFLQSRSRDEENFREIAEKLRPVVGEMYRDPTLSSAIAEHAENTLVRCIDGANYDLRQMQDMALAAKISRGGTDDIALYNHGLGFFMLNEVEKETGREVTRHSHLRQSTAEALHAHMYAVFYLQETFKFPHRQEDPRLASATFMTRAIAEEIGEKVRRSAVENHGEKFFDFMSQWDPWIAHVKRQPLYQPRFEENSEIFEALLSAHQANCNIPGTKESAMTEHKKLQRSDEIREKYNNWNREVVAEITREFLFNHRAFYLSRIGEMPSYFETGQNRNDRHNETPARQDAGPSHR